MSGVRGILVQSETSALYALMWALSAAPQTRRQLKEMSVEDNPLLMALRTDMRKWPEGGVKALQGQLQQSGLVLDVYNLLSLELIQHPEYLSQDPPILESTFLGRRQLCMDVQITALLSHESLPSLLSTYAIESLPCEFPLALLWDQVPVPSSICSVLHMLSGIQTYVDRHLRVVSMTLSKGTVALTVVAGKDGWVRVKGEAAEMQMKVEEFIRFAAQWEVKPDIVFLASEGDIALPQVSQSTRDAVEAVIRESETVELKAPVPSIVLQEREERVACVLCGREFEEGVAVCECGASWQCEFCETYNSTQDQICAACAKAKGEQPSSDSVQVTWRCSRCGYSDNRETDLTCTQCQATKAGITQPEPEDKWNCGNCGKPNFTWSLHCLACFTSKDGPQKSDKWVCEQCQTENPQHRAYCRSCYSAKTRLSEELTERKQRKCGSCGRENRSGSDSCLLCKVKQLGEWKCTKCQGSNSQKAKFCEHCFASKPNKDTGNCLICGAESVDTKCTKCRQKARNTSHKDDSSRLWTCIACEALNFQSDSHCYRCKQAKSGLEDTAEWTCPMCSHTNKGETETCTRCFREKEQGKACERCRKVIFGGLNLCEICDSKKAWKCPDCGLTSNTNECRFCQFEKAPRCRSCGKLVLTGQDTCVLCRTKPNTWQCPCGHTNSGYFCQGCHKMKPISR